MSNTEHHAHLAAQPVVQLVIVAVLDVVPPHHLQRQAMQCGSGQTHRGDQYRQPQARCKQAGRREHLTYAKGCVAGSPPAAPAGCAHSSTAAGQAQTQSSRLGLVGATAAAAAAAVGTTLANRRRCSKHRCAVPVPSHLQEVHLLEQLVLMVLELPHSGPRRRGTAAIKLAWLPKEVEGSGVTKCRLWRAPRCRSARCFVLVGPRRLDRDQGQACVSTAPSGARMHAVAKRRHSGKRCPVALPAAPLSAVWSQPCYK